MAARRGPQHFTEMQMAFKWEGFFETGIALVDQQHRDLVELVNQAAPLLGGGQPLEAGALDAILDRLFEYAAEHFADEEALMRRHALAEAHVRAHCGSHARFVATLTELRSEAADLAGARGGSALLRFLTGWLSFHILDEDQPRARSAPCAGRALIRGVSGRVRGRALI